MFVLTRHFFYPEGNSTIIIVTCYISFRGTYAMLGRIQHNIDFGHSPVCMYLCVYHIRMWCLENIRNAGKEVTLNLVIPVRMYLCVSYVYVVSGSKFINLLFPNTVVPYTVGCTVRKEVCLATCYVYICTCTYYSSIAPYYTVLWKYCLLWI